MSSATARTALAASNAAAVMARRCGGRRRFEESEVEARSPGDGWNPSVPSVPNSPASGRINGLDGDLSLISSAGLRVGALRQANTGIAVRQRSECEAYRSLVVGYRKTSSRG